MFEFEIMVTGYTIVVATTSVVISKCVCRKRINKINNELLASKRDLQNAESEIKRLKTRIALKEKI